MAWRDRVLNYTAELDESTAKKFQYSASDWHTVEARPPKGTLPETLPEFIRGIQELQSKWFKFQNTSPAISFEIRRPRPSELRFQYSAPTKRLERKIRTHLTNNIPGAELVEGADGLPVTEGDTVGGGLLTAGQTDWYPLQTEFDNPPINAVTGALHRHSMQDTRVVIQLLFRPIVDNPVWNWWRTRRTYQRIGYLRREKQKLWNSRKPTPRERRQADAIEDKAGTIQFQTSLRILTINAGENTRSRVKEISGGYNTFENPDTGQYLNTVTAKSLRKPRLVDFAEAVAERKFDGWHRSFRTSIPELAGLVSLPSRSQANITRAKP